VYLIGVDSGGTFTDTVIMAADGRVAIGKAPTTPSRISQGVLDSIAEASVQIGDRDALRSASMLAHGTTAGVNALLTRTGARVGMLMTSGFEDTIPIARINKVLGLPEDMLTDATRWDKPPMLLPRRQILGVMERVDVHGQVVLPLDESQARAQARRLREEGVEAVGVCLLWSFVNSAHEERLTAILAEELPGVPVTLSSQIAPRIGEYERAMTVLLNAYLAPVVSGYLGDLEERLRLEGGFGGSLLIMQSKGGVQRVRELMQRPIDTLKSGPVGGISASIRVGRLMGHENIISTDVGGTSFDVGLVVRGQPQYARRPMIGRYAIASTVADVESIGTGGGSIAWIDPDSRSLRVGPQSAGAVPGPVCYGRGGTEPTVTDAAATLGYLRRLGGHLELDVEGARSAIAQRIAEPLGMTVEAAAEGILDVANAAMADLVRRVTVQRGHDPREFALYAFGGAAPQYAGRYAADLGVRELVIPMFAAVFSAYGAVASDVRTSAEADIPRPYPPPADWTNARLAELQARVESGLSDAEGHQSVQVTRFAGLRFRRQVHEVRVPLPAEPLTDAGADGIAADFHREYERLYGPGTAYTDAGIELVGLRVEGRVLLDSPTPSARAGASRAPVETRSAWFEGRAVDCPVYDGEALAADFEVAGPAFVELPTTTLVVYPRQSARIDPIGNITLRLEEAQ
jgi:N-methylhydantoinase A